MKIFSELLLKNQSTTPALIRLHLWCILILATSPDQKGNLVDFRFPKRVDLN
jgi:hypothetical protein